VCAAARDYNMKMLFIYAYVRFSMSLPHAWPAVKFHSLYFVPHDNLLWILNSGKNNEEFVYELSINYHKTIKKFYECDLVI